MNLGENLRIWRRRWILTLLLLILAVAGSTAAVMRVPRVYTADSSLILLASRSAARLNGGNPYLSFSPSLTLTASALSEELMAQGTINNLAFRGFGVPYTVALAPYTTTTTGSVLLVTVTGHGKAAVEHTLTGVTDEIQLKLAQLQSSVIPRNKIRAGTLSFSPTATVSVSQTARVLVVIIAPVLLLAFGIPVLVDGRASRRRIRRLRSAQAIVPDQETLSDQDPGTADRQADGDRVTAGRQQAPDGWPSADHRGRPRRVRTGK